MLVFSFKQPKKYNEKHISVKNIRKGKHRGLASYSILQKIGIFFLLCSWRKRHSVENIRYSISFHFLKICAFIFYKFYRMYQDCEAYFDTNKDTDIMYSGINSTYIQNILNNHLVQKKKTGTVANETKMTAKDLLSHIFSKTG